jgi:hypothetical protein
VAAAVALLALPTVAIDVYNTQDITNFGKAPGFRWTLLLSPDELEALAWIRGATSPAAVVQIDPVARGVETWAHIPAFAERRMAAGVPISMIPLAPYEAASRRVANMFRGRDSREIERRALALGIDYIYVGPPERAAHPDFEHAVDQDSARFVRIFGNHDVSIYRLARSRRR